MLLQDSRNNSNINKMHRFFQIRAMIFKIKIKNLRKEMNRKLYRSSLNKIWNSKRY